MGGQVRNLFSAISLIIFMFFSNGALHGATASGRVVMEYDLSAHGASQEANLWIPYPMTNGNQSITNMVIEGSYSSSGVYTDGTHQTPMLHASWKAGVKERKMTVSFDVERQEVVKRSFPREESSWDPLDYVIHLAPTQLGPIDGEVKRLAKTITANKHSVLAKAKAIYDWTCENTFRDPETKGCGFGDVLTLLKRPGGKCTDISSIYVALARASGVPSREVFGIRLGRDGKQDITKWQHCWAEFYLPGYGWVPVDPADVRKMMLKEKLTLSDKKTSYYRNYFWGGVDPYRVKLSEGRDLLLNPAQKGDAVNYLMYPYAQIGGKTIDWLEPETFKYKITFHPRQTVAKKGSNSSL
jgi:transglutaminase-like putative cysteine protease